MQILDDASGARPRSLVARGVLRRSGAAFCVRARARRVRAILTVLGAGAARVPVHLPRDLAGLRSWSCRSDERRGRVRDDVRCDAPVVMVVFDEFDPNMLMDARGGSTGRATRTSPRSRDDATWYRNATTVNSQTTLAVPALLSGRAPDAGHPADRDRLPQQPVHACSATSLLAANVTETATELCPSACAGAVRARRVRCASGRWQGPRDRVAAPARARAGSQPSCRPSTRTSATSAAAERRPGRRAEPADVPTAALSNRPGSSTTLCAGSTPTARRPALTSCTRAAAHPVAVPADRPAVRQHRARLPGPRPARRWTQRPLPGAARASSATCSRSATSTTWSARLMARLRAQGIYDKALIVLTADHGVSLPARRAAPRPDAPGTSATSPACRC